MKYLYLTLFFCSIVNLSIAQTVEIDLKPVHKDYYAWITYLSEGPTHWLEIPEEEVEGRSFRVCITSSEIYNSLYIEEVTFGTEGCCKKIAVKKELDLYELFNQYELTGEISNVEFLKWVNTSTFQLLIMDHIFSISLQQDKATITRKK